MNTEKAALCEPVSKRQMHQDDLKVIHAIGKKIEENPAMIPGIAALAREYCTSVSESMITLKMVIQNISF